MKTLEELIQAAAKKGEMNHLSVITSGKGFSATYCPASTCAHSTEYDADPAEALRKAIDGWKPRKRSALKDKPESDFG